MLTAKPLRVAYASGLSAHWPGDTQTVSFLQKRKHLLGRNILKDTNTKFSGEETPNQQET